MAEIEITLPTVQYGNVKVRATPEEFGVELSAPGSLGTAMAVYLNLFTQGFAVGAKLPVELAPTEGLKAPLTASQDGPGQSGQDEETAAQTAVQSLDEGLGGVTEMGGQDPEGPGEEPAPWDKPQLEAQPKPWEQSKQTPVASAELSDW